MPAFLGKVGQVSSTESVDQAHDLQSVMWAARIFCLVFPAEKPHYLLDEGLLYMHRMHDIFPHDSAFGIGAVADVRLRCIEASQLERAGQTKEIETKGSARAKDYTLVNRFRRWDIEAPWGGVNETLAEMHCRSRRVVGHVGRKVVW